MTATQTWILRSSVVSGMIVAVVTVLYLTPMPEQHFKSCDRPCHDLDWPMICRIKFNLEVFHTLGRSCEECPRNTSHCSKRHCVSADGQGRALLTANRQLPGPSIQVCRNDIVVVDVANRVPGQEFTLHWRGQHMQATPCMDGAPMISQCSIPSFTTFQYKFRASSPGTHLWHAFSKSHEADGIFGALIVREADLIDPQKQLYDVDDKDHLMVITEWNRKSAFFRTENVSLLINGRNNFDGYLPRFIVKKGLRYRFRVAYASGGSECRIEVSVQKHLLKVISLDGNPTVPYEVSSVVLGPGERLDLVLKASETSDTYDIKVTSKCDNIKSVIVALAYEDVENNIIDKLAQSEINKNSDVINKRVFYSNMCESELGKVCINDVQSLFVMPAALRAKKVDHKMYFMLDSFVMDNHGEREAGRIPRVNNITFTFPSSPLLTQLDEIAPETLCNQDKKPPRCHGHDICDCVHVEHIPMGSTVEIIFVDRDGYEENSFHMHGHSFYVVGFHQFTEPVTMDTAKDLDNKGLLFKRNLKGPAHKDTIRIEKFGAVAIRFIANNPGFWLLRDERAHHWTRGMDLVLQVGTAREFQSTPFDFPTCGNWIGPEFFLV